MDIKYKRNVFCLQRIDQKKDIGHLPKLERHLPDYNHVSLPYKTYLCDENPNFKIWPKFYNFILNMLERNEKYTVSDKRKKLYFHQQQHGNPFGERVGHGGWLIGLKFFRTEAYPTCVSSKLCEFI